jgi:hypothetical protein
MLSFSSKLACFADEFQSVFAIFIGNHVKMAKTPFVSAVSAKRMEK